MLKYLQFTLLGQQKQKAKTVMLPKLVKANNLIKRESKEQMLSRDYYVTFKHLFCRTSAMKSEETAMS